MSSEYCQRSASEVEGVSRLTPLADGLPRLRDFSTFLIWSLTCAGVIGSMELERVPVISMTETAGLVLIGFRRASTDGLGMSALINSSDRVAAVGVLSLTILLSLVGVFGVSAWSVSVW